jgi:uncharacterized protein YfaS (alpha-2-macroglobulin family)
VKIKPSTEVKTEWISDSELAILPVKAFSPEEVYTLEVGVHHLYDDLEPPAVLTTTFNIRPPYIEVEEGRLYPKGRDSLVYSGRLRDFGFVEDISKRIKIDAFLEDARVISNVFTNDEGDLAFTIGPMARGGNDAKLRFSVMVDGIDLKDTAGRTLAVPARDKFSVMEVLPEEGGSGIRAIFSSELEARQDFNGLVTISGQEQPRVVVDGNQLAIYPRVSNPGEYTLRLHPGIRSTDGTVFTTQYSTMVRLGGQPPELKFTQANKTIVPDPNKAVVSFEAINLRSVILRVERIHNHNVLQHLQINDFSGEWQLNRVGEPILMKRVDITNQAIKPLHHWNRYRIDLSEYVKQEQGALYRVALGFEAKDAVLDCGSLPGTSAPPLALHDEEGALIESYDQGFDYRNYDWRERNNPCHASFYTRDKWAYQTVFSTPFSIIAKADVQGHVTVFVSDIMSGLPVANAEVEVLNYQQRSLISGRTNSEGRIDLNLEDQPSFVRVTGRKYTGYLKIREGESLSMSPFEVGGEQIEGKSHGFLYTDRGIWRPGDTIFLNFMNDETRWSQVSGEPVICELLDPKGVVHQRKVQTKPVGGIYSFKINTPKEGMTGLWKAILYKGGSVFEKQLPVEVVKPNRLDVRIDLGKEILTHSDLETSAMIEVEWLTGAKANDVDLELFMSSATDLSSLGTWSNYRFTPDEYEWRPEKEMVYKGLVGTSGRRGVPLDLSGLRQAYSPVRLALSGRAFEPSGDFTSFVDYFDIHPFSHYAGIEELPEGRSTSLAYDEDHTINLLAVRPNAKAEAGRKLNVKVHRLEWKWWWDRTSNRSSFLADRGLEVVYQDEVTSIQGPTPFTLKKKTLSRGRYLLDVMDVGSGHRSSMVFYVHEDDYWWLDDSAPEGAAVLQFNITDDEVNVGQAIEIEVPTQKGGRLLMTIESSNGVLQSAWANTSEGSTRLSLAATKEMKPNIYVHLALIQPYEDIRPGQPIRSYGVKPVTVLDEKSILAPVLIAPDVVKPEEEFEIRVSESTGRKMAYTLALVDEGLLSLTNFATPDPKLAFLAKQALGLRTWDNYDEILGAEDGSGNGVLAIGGDEDITRGKDRQDQRFKPVVRHFGPYLLPEGGEGVHKIKLPPYLGKLRAMLVTGYRGAYGTAEKEIIVREDLMSVVTAPRVLSPGDVIDLPVTLFSMMKEEQNITAEISVSGPIAVVGPSKLVKTLCQDENKTAAFRLKALDFEGSAEINISVSGGGKRISNSTSVPVAARNKTLKFTVDTVLGPGDTLRWPYEPLGMEGTNAFILEASRIPSLSLRNRIDYLLDYPYGCGEQITSKLMAQLQLPKLEKLDSLEMLVIRRNLDVGLRKLISLQLPGGGISFWPGANAANSWLSTYVAHMVLMARQNGFAVPEHFIDDLMAFEKRRAGSWTEAVNGDDLNSQTYRLFILALNGQADMGAMNRLRSKVNVSFVARHLLAAAYHFAGFDETARELISKGDMEGEDDRFTHRFGGPMLKRAIELYSRSYMSSGPRDFDLAQAVAADLGADIYMNTHVTAWSLIALAGYTDQLPSFEGFHLKGALGGDQFDLTGNAPLHEWLAPNGNEPALLEVINMDTVEQRMSLIRKGRPIKYKVKEATSPHVKLKVEYYDMEGKVIDFRKLEQGTTFKARITVTPIGSLYQDARDLALSFIVPAGWEIINTRYQDLESEERSMANYTDIRDDRVVFHFDQNRRETVFNITLNATYKGDFYMPAVVLEAMYDEAFSCSTASYEVRVLQQTQR